MSIEPVTNAADRPHTNFNILPNGMFEQTKVVKGEKVMKEDQEFRTLTVTLRQAMSYVKAPVVDSKTAKVEAV